MSETHEQVVAFQVAMTFAECDECQKRFAVLRDYSETNAADQIDVDAARDADFCPFCGAALI